MLAQEELTGKWHSIRARLKNKWAKLTDDDLASIDAGIEALIGRIQQRTGESREAIEHFLDQAGQQVAASAEQMGDALHDAAHETVRQARHHYRQAEQAIHERPAQALLVAFGVGVVSGLGAALLLTSHRKEKASAFPSLRQTSEQLGRHLTDVIMDSLPKAIGGRR
jgi:ElaB/YqjD/DUF883 family membrane-anchored ribosome-binding protein